MTAHVTARPVSASSVPVPSSGTPSAAPATTSPRAPVPQPADVRHQATGDVHALQATRAAGPNTDRAYRGAINEAVRVYLADGPSGLRVHLGDNAGALSALANVPAGRLEDDLETALEQQASVLRYPITGMDASTMQGIVESVAGARIRQGIVQEAETVVGARLRDLQTQSDTLPQRLETLRHARPGTAEAIEAQVLGIRGDAGDLQRARASISRSAEGLQTFVNRMRGQSWQPGEFPDAAARAARRLNLQGAADSSGVTAGARTEAPGAHVHGVLQLAESAHVVVEAGHLAHAGAAAVGGAVTLTVGVVGLLVGATIHHYTEEAHQAHLRFGHSLGL